MSELTETPGTPRYALERRLATGGMGEVWVATDSVLGREVALKILKHEYADDPTSRTRFQTEARSAAALDHPNVASVFDFGELPGDEGSGAPRPFLVMELVPGQPLSALLRGGEPMPPETAANLVAQAADAVAAAHALGIVHRDIKPANLLVTPDGTVKITDFGIARALDGAALTATGQLVGTPQYLSPEQAEGRPATKASDIYALGVVLYEALAGRRPFDGGTPITVALKHLREEPTPLPESVPADLRGIVEVALAKDPAARFSSVADLAAALRGAPVDAPAHGVPATAGPVASGGVAGAGAAGAAAAVAADQEIRGEHGTQVLTRPPDPAPTPRRHGRWRMPGWLPWAAAALAVLAAIVVLADVASHDQGNASADTTAPPAAPSRTADNRVSVRKSDYLGMRAEEAKALLEDKGLQVTEGTWANPDSREPGTVADLSPVGMLPRGSTVTLQVWGAPQPKDKSTWKHHGPGGWHDGASGHKPPEHWNKKGENH